MKQRSAKAFLTNMRRALNSRLRITILVLAIGLGGFIFLRGYDQAKFLHDSWFGDYQRIFNRSAPVPALQLNAEIDALNFDYKAKTANVWGHVIESEVAIVTVAIALFVAAPFLERKTR